MPEETTEKLKMIYPGHRSKELGKEASRDCCVFVRRFLAFFDI